MNRIFTFRYFQITFPGVSLGHVGHQNTLIPFHTISMWVTMKWWTESYSGLIMNHLICTESGYGRAKFSWIHITFHILYSSNWKIENWKKKRLYFYINFHTTSKLLVSSDRATIRSHFPPPVAVQLALSQHLTTMCSHYDRVKSSLNAAVLWDTEGQWCHIFY